MKKGGPSGAEESAPSRAGQDQSRKEMTRGAGLALLGRLGALVEAAGFPIFLWLYGSVTFGLFATLYAIVRMASGVTQMGMDVALQRFIPSYDDEDAIHRTLAIALLITMGAGIIGALLLIFYAPMLARMIDGDGEDTQHIVTVIRIYAVTLPLWTSVEVLTASVRSRRKFGPEIRIRFFYEQILRIVIAVGLAFVGLTTYGLFLAHILSLAIAALLSFFLVARFYDYKRLFMAGYDPKLAKAMLHFALPMMPATLIQRIFSEFPVLVLNIIIPGAAGASAAGFYSIARKLSSVMQVIHNSFDYVVAPLAAFQKGRGDRETLADMYAYSTRLMVAFGVILAGAMVGSHHALLDMLGPESEPAAVALVILVLGRLLTFFFGQAPAMVRSLSSTYWTLGNGLLGLLAMLGLLYLLVESHGPAGAALAAAAGLILSRGVALIEVYFLSRLWPYSKEMWKPLFVSICLSLILFTSGVLLKNTLAPVQILVLVVLLILSILAFFRYGLSAPDAKALGRLAHFARRGLH
ncbi:MULTISPECIES: oligosaccharide flippase family protein [unclassified Iodidimonas]|uniref:lipopolysaccharide biosynthesis protein n=1 Tax=unclassified Iodidimonas TaxID=2626145 RepID=UPI00248212AC|nr:MULTISPECIES: oligosaccharide flippase family protein [unclassified Iodidimonas]